MGRRWAWLALVLAAACTPGARDGGPGVAGVAGGDRPREPGSAQSTGREFGVEYHALIEGTVRGSTGQSLAGVEVVTDRMTESTPGSMPRNRAVTGPDGRFSVPAQASLVAPGDSARVRVVVIALGLRLVPVGSAVPVDSAVVAVTMVRTSRTPLRHSVELTLPIAPR